MHCLLVAIDSLGIDPLGHDREGSVYSGCRALFPPGRAAALAEGAPVELDGAPLAGLLVPTDVTAGQESGAIECALTYASIFSGRSAIERHGLMRGLGLRDALLEELIAEENLFACAAEPCLANALFPVHLGFLGSSYVEDLLPHWSRDDVEARLSWDGRALRLTGPEKHGLPELFTAAEINQNVFVHAARRAGVRLRDWDDVRSGLALTGSLDNCLENGLGAAAMGEAALPRRGVDDGAGVLARLSRDHDLVFYKYQLADLVSHSGRVDLARATAETVERLVLALLRSVADRRAVVLVTSDHGHLEQVGFTRGHPKSLVPTWVFAPSAEVARDLARHCGRPEGIFRAVAGALQLA